MLIKQASLIKGFALQPYLKAEEGLEYAASYGYDYFYLDGSLYSDFAGQWDESRIKKLIIKCAEHKIKPIYHGNYKIPLSSDVEALRLSAVECTKAEIDICARLQCPLIIHGGAIVEPRKILVAKKLALDALVRSLITLKQYADERGVEIWLENLSNYPDYKPFYYIATTVDEFAYILTHVKISIFFDFGHANVNAQCDVEEFFSQFHTSISGVSMSNNSGKLDQHLALNKGSMDYHSIIKTMLRTDWRGIIGFETRNTPPLQSIQKLQSIIDSVNLTPSLLACG